MKNVVFIAFDRHIMRLRQSSKEATEAVRSSLVRIQSSLAALAEIDRKKAPPPDSPVRPIPNSHSADSPWTAPSLSARASDSRSPALSFDTWDIYPDVPKAIRFGEVEAANEREAIEKAVKKFKQDPAVLIAVRRPYR